MTSSPRAAQYANPPNLGWTAGRGQERPGLPGQEGRQELYAADSGLPAGTAFFFGASTMTI